MQKKFVSNLFEVILGLKDTKTSVYGKKKLDGLHRDHPPAWELVLYVSHGDLWWSVCGRKVYPNKISHLHRWVFRKWTNDWMFSIRRKFNRNRNRFLPSMFWPKYFYDWNHDNWKPNWIFLGWLVLLEYCNLRFESLQVSFCFTKFVIF